MSQANYVHVITDAQTGEVTEVPFTQEEIDALTLQNQNNLIQWRESCTVRNAALRLVLIDDGLSTVVKEAIKTAPEALQTKWEYEPLIKRNDPDLILFAKTALSMSDSEIDELFRKAEQR